MADNLYSENPEDEGLAMSVDPGAPAPAPAPAPGIPPQYSAGRMPRIPMNVNRRMASGLARQANEGRGISADRTVGVEMAPAPPQEPQVPEAVPGAAGVDFSAAAAAAAQQEAEIQAIAGPRRYLGPPTTQTEKVSAQRRILSPEAEQTIARLSGDASAAEERAREAADRHAALLSEAEQKKADALGIQMQAQEAARARMEERTAQMRAQSEALRAAAERDDADAEELKGRYATRDTMRRIVGAVGMYFAGYGAGMQGRDPTGAMQFIQANIDASWERDMQSLRDARGKGDRKRSYAAQLLEETGSEEAAYHRYRAESMDVFEAQAKRMALASGSQEILEKHKELSARMDAERAASQIRSIEEEAPLIESESLTKQRFGGVTGVPTKELREAYKENIDRQRDNQDFALREGIKQRASAGGDKEVAALRERITTLDAAESGITEAMKSASRGSGVVFDESEADTTGRAATAADMLRSAGMTEAADAMAKADTPAKQAAIMAAALPEVRRRKALAKSSAPPSVRTAVATRPASFRSE